RKQETKVNGGRRGEETVASKGKSERMGRQVATRRILPKRDHSNIRRPDQGPTTKLPLRTTGRPPRCQDKRDIACRLSKASQRTGIRETRAGLEAPLAPYRSVLLWSRGVVLPFRRTLCPKRDLPT